MEDVARLAGVSAITVSRVVNQPDKVAPKTRAKVEAAIRRTGYVPNLMAGSLASNRSKIIAAIVPTIANSIFAETIEGLSAVVTASGYQLLLGQSEYSASTEEALIAAFLGRRVDGLVLTGVRHSQAARSLLARAGVPVVETWDLTPHPIDMLVGFSNEAAGYAMARHLIERGRRAIAYVGGTDERSAARRVGCMRALDEAHLTPSPGRTIHTISSIRAGREAIASLVEAAPSKAKLDAVFCSNDVLALGILLECQARGWPVPKRIAIAGFADLEIAAEISPALTTVQVRGREIGEHAARLLLGRLVGRGLFEQVVDLGFSVVLRETT